jgi:hypothetical protein
MSNTILFALLVLPGMVLTLYLLFGAVLVGLDQLRLRPQFRFLLTPPPYPPLEEEACNRLRKARQMLYDNDADSELMTAYIRQIDAVLVTRSREELLKLHALRFDLLRKARKVGRR